MSKKCYNCVYWDMIGIAQHNLKKGLCRRYPPLYGKFPTTYETDWCGEFKKRKDPFENTNNK